MKTSNLDEYGLYLFHQGTNFHAYEMLGAHLAEQDGKKGVRFAVWAKNAKSVSVVGDFNGWDSRVHRMIRLDDGETWEIFIEGVKAGALYKYSIEPQWGGPHILKADPYGFYAEKKPATASRVYDLENYEWSDGEYMEAKTKEPSYSRPMLIYEVHAGSWQRKHKNEGDGKEGYLSYRELADKLIAYVKKMNYTHIEFMPLTEHPFDGSWGYQTTGYYAATSRYGEPDDFRYLVDMAHRNGIGVIMDWVPAHFPRDDFGLADFDGEPLYEHPDPRLGEHPDWGTKIFNYGKTEVKNFLIANVLYWAREFHVDGIRVDAVASMLYLDYGKKDGQWLPNEDGGNKNYEAIEFFKHLNSVVRGSYPSFLTIAEESTAWPKITGRVEDDGLGFSFKWNMGWMHDFCEYMKQDAYFRKGAHNLLTFAMSYNSAENYILPLSHDEVVHLKCSMVNKMPGYEVDKYANLRLGYTFMIGHEGKKLLFMGQEFGQEREWSEKRELDWFLLDREYNRGMQTYVKDLLEVYNKYPCLYRIDNDWAGFEWMNADDADRSVYSFVRRDETGKNNLLFVLNMTPMRWENYWVPVPSRKKFKLVLNSDDKRYGGNGNAVPEDVPAQVGECVFQKYHLVIDLAPYTALIFKF